MTAQTELDPRLRDTALFGQPKGLAPLFLTELWERFSYYGMRAILVLYMVAPPAQGGLGFDVKRAASIYGWYTMSVYITALPGGLAADYLLGAREQHVYRELLAYLYGLRERAGLWITLPAEVNRWWRQRHEMRLVPAGDDWRIEGSGSERARLAWATIENGRVTYSVDPA